MGLTVVLIVVPICGCLGGEAVYRSIGRPAESIHLNADGSCSVNVKPQRYESLIQEGKWTELTEWKTTTYGDTKVDIKYVMIKLDSSIEFRYEEEKIGMKDFGEERHETTVLTTIIARYPSEMKGYFQRANNKEYLFIGGEGFLKE